jgi:hypothetical protein
MLAPRDNAVSADDDLNVRWIQTGVAAGFLSCLIYPLVIFGGPPVPAAVALIAAFGPLLALASLGLTKLLAVHRRTVAAEAAALLNTIGGALFSTMLLIQFAVPMFTGVERVGRETVGVWLGVDVAWDAYIASGTALFALSMFRHPRFGKVFAATGLVIAVVLFALNMYAFPNPPDTRGLIDAGPLVGAWYLAVSIQTLRSIPWARSVLAGAR